MQLRADQTLQVSKEIQTTGEELSPKIIIPSFGMAEAD